MLFQTLASPLNSQETEAAALEGWALNRGRVERLKPGGCEALKLGTEPMHCKVRAWLYQHNRDEYTKLVDGR